MIKTLLDIPLWEIADLEQPSGTGDKKILRQVNMLMTIFNSPRNFINQKCYLKVAKMLGLHEVAKMPKRAIQVRRDIF